MNSILYSLAKKEDVIERQLMDLSLSVDKYLSANVCDSRYRLETMKATRKVSGSILKLASSIKHHSAFAEPAFEFAKAAHENSCKRHPGRPQMRRWSNEPYINHPERVAITMISLGDISPIEISAALLHDVLEDTTVTEESIAGNFGHDVLYLVKELTSTIPDTVRMDRALRKYYEIEKLKSVSIQAKRIKLADRIDNITDSINNDSVPENFRLTYAAETNDLIDAIGYADLVLTTHLKELVFKLTVGKS